MQEPPIVTIGLPVFNGERYLASALDSLLAQRGCSFELIVSDNNSTDRTKEICEEYAARDPRIRYHRNAVNLGAALNYNLVFTMSNTEFFKWAPYDDLVEPDFLIRCIEVLRRDPSVILCYSRATIIDADGNYEVDYNPGPDTSSPDRLERFQNLILRPEYALQQMGVVRSEVLRKTVLHGPYPSSDEILIAELSLLGRFHELPERMYHFRRHAAQSTGIPTQRERLTFYDPSLVDKIIFPTWRYVNGAKCILQRHFSTWHELLRGYTVLLRWAVRPDHLRALGKDLLLAAYRAAMRMRTFNRDTDRVPTH